MVKKIVRRLTKSEGGAAILEFAMVVPILLLLVLGIIEFGWVLHGVITITGAAREGARLAVVNDYDDITEVINNHASAWTITSISGIAPGVAAGDIRTVRVNGNLNLLVAFFFDDFNYTAEANMRQEGFVAAGNGNGSGEEPTAPSAPTSSWNGQHLDLSDVTSGATVTLYDDEGGIIGEPKVADGSSVRFDNIKNPYSGQTLSFKQSVNGVDSELGTITVP